VWDGEKRITEQAMNPASAWVGQLAQANHQQAGESLRLPEHIKKGLQHSTLFRLGCSMRAKGFAEPEIFAALWEANQRRCEEPGSREDIQKLAASICAQYAPGEVGAMTSEKQWTFKNATKNESADWPEPLPIGSELPPVAAFDLALLPEALRDFVEDLAERMQVPLDYPAACLMVSLAGAVNRRAVMQPKRSDSSWQVVPNLWGGIVAPPGFLKSPVLHAISKPLYAQEALWRVEHESQLVEYEMCKEDLDLRLAAWKEQIKSAYKKGPQLVRAGEVAPPPPIRPDVSMHPPILRRLLTCDSTFEKLHELMKDNPAGLLVVRDELTGWWAELDREGRQGERGFFLSAWNGDTPYSLDRIGRGSIHVPACCVSMIGGITPGRLRSYLVDALQDGPSNDGLIQRFQVLVWPDPPRNWRYVDRQPEKHEAVERIFERVLSWDVEFAPRFRFEDAAQEFFIDWLRSLEQKIRNDDSHPAIISHLGKYRKLMPALGLLLSTADQIATQGALHDPALVFREHAQQAARWCDYLESHARRIYACVVTATMQAAADLARKLKAKVIGADGTFAVRDVYRHGWTHLDTPERSAAALAVLEDAGWVRRIPNEVTPGRPSNRYLMNPKVEP
jgi:putative DNA primase/helicase